MIDKEPGWKVVLRINLRFIGAALALFYGWTCWQMASKEWWGFWIAGGLGMFGGWISFLGALFELKSAISRFGTINTYEGKGEEARADRAPDHQDLKDRGMKR